MISASSSDEERPMSPLFVVPEDIADLTDDNDDDEDPEKEQDMASLAPAVLPINFGAAAAEALKKADARDDTVLRDLVSPDLLDFKWSGDPQIFKGAKETFTGKAGPTFPLLDSTNPLSIFLKIWDESIIDMIVNETNKYAAATIATSDPLEQKSRLKTWTPTNRQEILLFLGIYQMHSLVHFPVQKNYFCLSGFLAIPELASLMTYNRFILLKRFLRFAGDPSADLSTQQQKLHNIKPIVDRLTNKFRSLYKPGQNIAIDQSLLFWKSRLAFAQKIGDKAAKSIKCFELSDSTTGYLWNFFIYEDTDKNMQTNEGDGDGPIPDVATAGIVYDLASPLLNLGHTLVMDNYCNSPLLARFLKQQKTDVLGTLRVSREFVPEAIKSMTDMRVGELATSNTEDLAVVLWRESNLVCMISTYHKAVMASKEKSAKIKFKPQSVLDYNLLMGGVDKKCRLLSAYLMERTRNQGWEKKLFLKLLNVSILNCYVIYKCKSNIDHRSFRKNLAEALIAYSRPALPATVKAKGKRTVIKKNTDTTTDNRPILKGNHYLGKGKSKYCLCVWCRMKRNKTKRTPYKCEQCDVPLCLQNCFREYHS